MSQLQDYILRLVDDVDRAQAALAEHYEVHRTTRSWHPMGTPERTAADLRDRREHRRLALALEVATARAAVAVRWSRGHQPRWFWGRMVG